MEKLALLQLSIKILNKELVPGILKSSRFTKHHYSSRSFGYYLILLYRSPVTNTILISLLLVTWSWLQTNLVKFFLTVRKLNITRKLDAYKSEVAYFKKIFGWGVIKLFNERFQLNHNDKYLSLLQTETVNKEIPTGLQCACLSAFYFA